LVGKTSLSYRFTNDPPQEYEATIEEEVKLIINIDGKDCEVEIIDTFYDEEEYPGMMDMWISSGEGFLLVFSITDHESFELLKGIYDKILKITWKPMSYIISWK